jgi:hypothetical protein
LESPEFELLFKDQQRTPIKVEEQKSSNAGNSGQPAAVIQMKQKSTVDV